MGLPRGGPTAYAENLILFDFIQQHYTVQSYECNKLKYINVNNKLYYDHYEYEMIVQ